MSTKAPKRPAHETLFYVLEETITVIENGVESEEQSGMNAIYLAAVLQIFRRTLIPKKHLGWVVGRLRDFRAQLAAPSPYGAVIDDLITDIQRG